MLERYIIAKMGLIYKPEKYTLRKLAQSNKNPIDRREIWHNFKSLTHGSYMREQRERK